VCKISCAGPQTYKEHLDGQRHKKKEAQLKSGNVAPNPKRHGQPVGGISLRCELCDVTCTGNDAYAAHIRGAKHQKVVKLHTKLGKPIPPNDPVVVAPNTDKTAKTGDTSASAGQTASAAKIKVLGTPRINFIGGGRLHTTNSGELREESTTEDTTASGQQELQQDFSVTESSICQLSEQSDAQPVGQDYIDEIKGDDQKVVSFHCKLCDCRFNDPNAKEMHLKGRRHRLQFKKKVDPSLVVEVKPSLKHRKFPETKDRRYNNYKRDVHYWNDWYTPNSGRYYDSRPPMGGPPMPPIPPPHMGPPPPPGFGNNFMGSPMPPFRRGSNSSSWDDIHILQKHSEICPKEEELDEIHHLVSCVERALKLVSDRMTEEDANLAMNDIIKREFEQIPESGAPSEPSPKEKTPTDANTSDVKPEESQFRLMKGLMRVGPLAKGLLLTGDKDVDLVVICAQKPTKPLLQRIVDLLPSQLQVSYHSLIKFANKHSLVYKLIDCFICRVVCYYN
jgi:zinc finger RNA-binding protein